MTVTGAPIRLDRFLLAQSLAAGLGRRRIGALFEHGAVRVNGKRARKGLIVQAGDTITVAALAPPAPAASPSISLTIVYRDDDLVAVDKPPGLPSTLGPTPGPSLAAALLDTFPEMAALDRARHAGLAHRLDTGTSGLLLAARSPEAYARLRDAFRRKAVAKDYLAVVAGQLAGTHVVTTPLARHHRSRSRMVLARDTTNGKAWPAETTVIPIAGDDTLTVVRLRMRTGVTHQLRVHLASLGHPIVGDLRYGTRDAIPASQLATPGWHYLHAWTIAFDEAAFPRGLMTTFPEHWRPLFAARGWSTTLVA